MSESEQEQPVKIDGTLGREIRCAFCESDDVELFSLYGQTLLGTQYYCNNCRSIFEAVRFDED